MSAGRILRYERRRAGLSQRALAAATGVAQPAIARIERGVVSPRMDTMDRLLAATGGSMEVTRRLGDGVDRSLIQASLARTPEERVIAAGRAGRNLAAFLATVRDARRR
jgi:transcriptional regulator with XRE-family HTH domain